MNELCKLKAIELADLLRTRQVGVLEVVDEFLAHIESINPKVNAIVTTTFDAARAHAKKLDSSDDQELPLFGLPVAHKDLVATKGVRTTHGFPPHKNNIPEHNELFVDRMRNAGSILFGKTNTPEFGAGSHTFNRVFGPTRNPYDLERTVGGSSGGAAACLAARMLPIADGSDTGGSLRNPAAFCNVIGFRPSQGRVPMLPSGNPWADISQLGPMARCVDDVALLFSVIAGPDARAYGCLEAKGEEFRQINARSVRGLRIGYSRDLGGLPVEKEVTDALDLFVQGLEREGAIVTVVRPDFTDARGIFHILRAIGFMSYGDMPRSMYEQLKDTIKWNYEASQKLRMEDLRWAHLRRKQLINRFLSLFDENDLVIGPTTQVMPFPVETDWVRQIDGRKMETYIEWMEACSFVSVTGLPALSLPAGFNGGLPVGAQLIAPLRADKQLLEIAKGIEEVTNHAFRVPELIN